ncbi:Shedu anti-phage system protein SduA domain-containing protein [Streptomyces koyangensis]|uniref:Shedu anti-phage system protein SduA domain-containing protein n=1 Tax=Streptomyces koyangensis TaxID=188770 RepID=UPI00365C8F4D
MVTPGYRSSASLRGIVSAARELTQDTRVGDSIEAVLRIIGPLGGGTKYGKGRPLVDALEEVAREALLLGDFALAQRFQRCAAYARGDIFLEVLEHYYDAEARQSSEEGVRRLVSLGVDRVVSLLDSLAEDHPEATVADVQKLFRGIAQSMDHVGTGDGEGGVRLTTRERRRLQQYGHMELVLRNLPRPASPEAARMVADVLADVDVGLLAQVLELKARRAGLDALRAAVDDPDSTESALHTCLKNQEWIFGGAYVRELARRQYTSDAVLDIPLLRGDGSLHVVELKRARIGELVIRRNGHLMLGAPAHHAVSQVQNYLRAMDENRGTILAAHGVDTRRASATVVIGHPKYVTGKVTRQEIAETLRMYNAHSARIEVITYETLLESASRMLALSSVRQTPEENEGSPV